MRLEDLTRPLLADTNELPDLQAMLAQDESLRGWLLWTASKSCVSWLLENGIETTVSGTQPVRMIYAPIAPGVFVRARRSDIVDPDGGPSPISASLPELRVSGLLHATLQFVLRHWVEVYNEADNVRRAIEQHPLWPSVLEQKGLLDQPEDNSWFDKHELMRRAVSVALAELGFPPTPSLVAYTTQRLAGVEPQNAPEPRKGTLVSSFLVAQSLREPPLASEGSRRYYSYVHQNVATFPLFASFDLMEEVRKTLKIQHDWLMKHSEILAPFSMEITHSDLRKQARGRPRKNEARWQWWESLDTAARKHLTEDDLLRRAHTEHKNLPIADRPSVNTALAELKKWVRDVKRREKSGSA